MAATSRLTMRRLRRDRALAAALLVVGFALAATPGSAADTTESLLAQLETIDGPAFGPTAVEPGQLVQALAGTDGIDVEAIADVLDLAVARGRFAAATLAARGLEEALLPSDRPLDEPASPLPPAVRKALVRALDIPDAGLQFAAARTLALIAGQPHFSGSSRVVAVLVHAATATGRDRAVVAHHDAEICNEIAAGVSRFGYDPVRVSTGRAAVVAAREHADTTLVILGARIVLPSAYETAQFIHEQPHGDIPPILIVIDPLDDEARGRFLTKAIFKFSGMACVSLADRMESFFLPTASIEPDHEPIPPRFSAALEDLMGSQAAAPEARAAQARLRHERARQAVTLLAILRRRGWDIPDATLARLDLASARRDSTRYNQVAFTPSPPLPADAALLESIR